MASAFHATRVILVQTLANGAGRNVSLWTDTRPFSVNRNVHVRDDQVSGHHLQSDDRSTWLSS